MEVQRRGVGGRERVSGVPVGSRKGVSVQSVGGEVQGVDLSLTCSVTRLRYGPGTWTGTRGPKRLGRPSPDPSRNLSVGVLSTRPSL